MVKATSAAAPFRISPGAATRLLGWVMLGMIAIATVLMLLPNSRYYRWQQGDGTILFRARWIYERIHDDPTPIDVAMIGSSRMESTARTQELSTILSARLGRPIHVVNFGLPQEGRDLHWTIAHEVLEARPELRLIILSAGAEAVLSHPGFRFLGDDRSIAGSPIIYNPSYVENLLTLPYRHLAYFVQGLWPQAFQLSRHFDPAIYRARGFDPTKSFVTPQGKLVDREQKINLAELAEQRAEVAATRNADPKLRYLPIDRRYATERHFTRKIAALAAEKGVQVAFLHVPLFDEREEIADPQFYHAIGPTMEAVQFGSDPQDYADAGHLNRHGTTRLLPWLADQMTAILASMKAR